MNDHKPPVFADLTLSELWAAIKMTLIICVSLGILVGIFGGIGWYLSEAGSGAAARSMGFEDGKIPGPILVGLAISALVIWPGYFSSIVKNFGESIGVVLVAIANYWESATLFKRIIGAFILSLVWLLLVLFPLATLILLFCIQVFVDQVHRVKSDRQIQKSSEI
jgi:hypothetical protein